VCNLGSRASPWERWAFRPPSWSSGSPFLALYPMGASWPRAWALAPHSKPLCNTRDPRWVPSPKIDGQMGAGGGLTEARDSFDRRAGRR
jgi:hypothetical protein